MADSCKLVEPPPLADEQPWQRVHLPTLLADTFMRGVGQGIPKESFVPDLLWAVRHLDLCCPACGTVVDAEIFAFADAVRLCYLALGQGEFDLRKEVAHHYQACVARCACGATFPWPEWHS